MSKLISVFGGTGNQGGAVTNSILNEHGENLKVRVFTRNKNSEKSKELKKRGVDVVELDIVKENKDTITNALKGSYGVYLVTDYWTLKDKEIDVTKKVVDAIYNTDSVKHLVYSSLVNINKITNGQISSPEYDNKAIVEEYARELSSNSHNREFITSFIHCPFYAQNFHSSFITKNKDGDEYKLCMPLDPSLKPLEIGDINDIGPIALEIFKNPQKYSGVGVPFAGSLLHGDEIAEIISKSTGKTVVFQYIPPNQFDPQSIADMFRFGSQYGSFYGKDTTLASHITKLTTLEEYLTKNPIQLN